MRIIKADSKQFPKCAFCTHWGDVQNQHIRAVSDGKQWKYNELAVSLCKLHEKDTVSVFKCDCYKPKV